MDQSTWSFASAAPFMASAQKLKKSGEAFFRTGKIQKKKEKEKKGCATVEGS
jgi:hypothetical protein